MPVTYRCVGGHHVCATHEPSRNCMYCERVTKATRMPSTVPTRNLPSRPRVIQRKLDLDHVLHFGKYRGRTVEDVLEDDPRWLDWACENVQDFELDAAVAHELARKLGRV